ncbi:glycoside hydrolase family 13 protein [Sporolactobacillus spathodeae]|uniref:Neopullulanase n=1 Tax=Sporolactobacillus spathodeae TaxID=1465502 RepID=A0ABS2Q6Q2_9BACL|nr:glycoside hydrolase family 13 protein [Sporolactobacillus spathodeae]MBM7656667.1 neopullulanase [Sporolactobacillus spathodeae]
MEEAAIYHQPCSMFAYPYDRKTFHLRIRTKKGDIRSVVCFFGDPYENHKNENGRIVPALNQKDMRLTAQTELHDYWFTEVALPFYRLHYAFVLTSVQDETIFYGDRGMMQDSALSFSFSENFFKYPYIHENDCFKAPDWVKKTVWYQIFPERFANGNPAISPVQTLPWGSKDPGRDDFFGGDLQGIIDHLDYLQNLGINGIYLTPIFTAPTNHKYDTLDYFSVDPHFGDKEVLRTLIKQAHKRSIRVMLDAVFNHIGSTSMQWQDVIRHGENSRYKDWFYIRSFPVQEGENGNIEGQTTLSYDTFAFTPKMPKLNTENQEVRDYLLRIALYWIKEFDIDGWRLDVANEVDGQFWRAFHQAVIGEKSDCYIVGEIWHNAWNWLQGDMFHSVMNYPLSQTIIDYFIENKLKATQAVSAINAHYMNYQAQVSEVAFNLLDSHDTARILTKARGDKQKVRLALAFLFSQTGSPCIYYGTEVGMDGANDPLCRKCMIWDKEKQDLEMMAFVKKIIRLRKDNQPVLTYGRLDWLIVDNAKDLLCFRRVYQDRTLYFFFNHGNNDQTLSLDESNVLLFDLWNDYRVDGTNLFVPCQQFRIFAEA